MSSHVSGRCFWVTPFGLVPANILARSASEGMDYTHSRLGLVGTEYPSALSHAGTPLTLTTLRLSIKAVSDHVASRRSDGSLIDPGVSRSN